MRLVTGACALALLPNPEKPARMFSYVHFHIGLMAFPNRVRSVCAFASIADMTAPL